MKYMTVIFIALSIIVGFPKHNKSGRDLVCYKRLFELFGFAAQNC